MSPVHNKLTIAEIQSSQRINSHKGFLTCLHLAVRHSFVDSAYFLRLVETLGNLFTDVETVDATFFSCQTRRFSQGGVEIVLPDQLVDESGIEDVSRAEGIDDRSDGKGWGVQDFPVLV